MREEARSEGCALFECLAELSDAMLFVTDMAAKVEWVNAALVEQTGYTLEDYRFQRFENPFIPMEDIEHVAKFTEDFLKSKERVSGVVRNRFVDRWGGTLHVRSRMAHVLWKGQPALLYCTQLDDAERPPGTDVEERYRSLVEAATDAIVRLRADLTVHYSNRFFQGIVGLPPVELNRRPFDALVKASHQESTRELLTSDAERMQITVPIMGAQGRTVWLEGTFVRITRGPDVGLIQAILRDTTEQRLLNTRVQRAQKRESLGQMAGGIAHDLNNILTSVLGSASLAEEEVAPGSRVAEALGQIQLAARRAGELSSSMLAFAGEGNAEQLPIDLGALVSEMRLLLGSGLPKNINLQVRTPATPIAVLADEVQLRQVVMNLITNAADAVSLKNASAADAVQGTHSLVEVEAGMRQVVAGSLSGEQVYGTTLAPGRYAFVRVLDHGTGMPLEVQRRIFEPFYSTKAKGRGLGLAAVLGILERHNGCVRLQSIAGEGTEVEVLLPLTTQSIKRQSAVPKEAAPRPVACTLLVVDDEEAIRRLVCATLERLGYVVLEACSGEAALNVLSAHGSEVSVVLLDQTMPGMGGARTLQALRAEFPDLPVIRTSGYEADAEFSNPDSHTLFLGKPYNVAQLVDVVQRALEIRTA